MFFRVTRRFLSIILLSGLALGGAGANLNCGICLSGGDRCGLAPLLEDDGNSGILLFSLPTILQFNSAGVRASQALSAWQIGLRTDLVGTSRVEGGGSTASDPPNWITWADEGCAAAGVSDTLRASCPFSDPTIIGVCFTTFFNTGEILETTAILRRSYQESLVGESRKLAVVIHEIGHCLGLKHTDSTSNIMFASVTDTTGPSAAEFAAIDSVYQPLQSPSASTRDAFFDVTSAGNARRHFTFPVFTISSALTGGSAISSTTRRFSEFDERGPTTTRAHYIRRDGTCAAH